MIKQMILVTRRATFRATNFSITILRRHALIVARMPGLRR